MNSDKPNLDILEQMVQQELLSDTVSRIWLDEPANFRKNGLPYGFVESKPSLICNLENRSSKSITDFVGNVIQEFVKQGYLSTDNKDETQELLSCFVEHSFLPEFNNVVYDLNFSKDFHIGSLTKLNCNSLNGLAINDNNDQIYATFKYDSESPGHIVLIPNTDLNVIRYDEQGNGSIIEITSKGYGSPLLINHGDQIISESFPVKLVYINKGNPEAWYGKTLIDYKTAFRDNKSDGLINKVKKVLGSQKSRSTAVSKSPVINEVTTKTIESNPNSTSSINSSNYKKNITSRDDNKMYFNSYFNLAQEAYKKGSYGSAVVNYELAELFATNHKERANALLMIAKIMKKEKSYDTANNILTDILNFYNDDTGEIRYHLGTVLRLSGKEPDRALSLLQESLEYQPNNPWVHFNIGRIKESLGDTRGAVDAYSSVLKIKPTFMNSGGMKKYISTNS
jgi:tetratricopeptide (TPR) repeat protein